MNVIEDRLRAAARDLAAVPVPDLSTRVRHELAAGRASVSRRRRLPSLVPAVLSGLALLLVLTLAVPSARQAVADLLGLANLPVRVVPEAPPVGSDLDLGARADLRAARAAVDFPVRVPDILGAPDEVWLDGDAVPGGQVTLLWRADDDLPAAGPHGVGALLTILPGSLEPGVLAKSVWREGTTLTSVSVGDGVGWWVAGDAHVLAYLDANGAPRREESRLAGDTLLWQSGPVLYRLESGLPLADALRVARSLE